MKRLLCMLMTVCTLTVTAQDEKNVTLNEVTVKGARVVQKEISQHYRDYGNMITLKLSYRLDRGRQYRDIQRTMNHRDSETGILQSK